MVSACNVHIVLLRIQVVGGVLVQALLLVLQAGGYV